MPKSPTKPHELHPSLQTILCIAAHPDDNEFGIAGTVEVTGTATAPSFIEGDDRVTATEDVGAGATTTGSDAANKTRLPLDCEAVIVPTVDP